MMEVEVVLEGGPDTGEGVIIIVYTRPPAFGGGVHSMVTVEVVVPFMMLLSLTFPGGSITRKHNEQSMKRGMKMHILHLQHYNTH